MKTRFYVSLAAVLFLLPLLSEFVSATVSDTAWTVTLPENEYVVFAEFSSDDSLIFISIYYTNDKEYDPDSAYTSVRNSHTGEEIRKTVGYKWEWNRYVTVYTKPFTDTTYMFKYTNSVSAPYFYIFRMNDKTGQIFDSIPVNVDIPEFKNDTNFVNYDAITPDGKRYFMVLSIISGYDPAHIPIYEHKLFVWNTENWTIDRSFYYNGLSIKDIASNGRYYTERSNNPTNRILFSDINNDTTMLDLMDNDSIHYDDVIFPKKDTNKFLLKYFDRKDYRNKIQVRSQTDFSIIKTIDNDTLRNSLYHILLDSQYLVFAQGDFDIYGNITIYDIINNYVVYTYPVIPFLGNTGHAIVASSNNKEFIVEAWGRSLHMLNAKYTTTSTKEQNEEIPYLIYPNPAEDYIEISYPPSEKRWFGGVSIFNVLGMEINKSTLTPALSLNGEGVRIDVSQLAPGVYFVRIGDVVRKFLKL